MVITAPVHQLISGLFVVEDRGAHTLKGHPDRLTLAANSGQSVRRLLRLHLRQHQLNASRALARPARFGIYVG